MVEKEYIIKKMPEDLEKALSEIALSVREYWSEITVNLDGARYGVEELFVGGHAVERNGKSLMALKTLEYKVGSKIHIQAKGKDEKEAIQVYLDNLEKYM
jgi:phosphotransferase system HPr-like phosphotransfer protein